jgi:hypothetical protein
VVERSDFDSPDVDDKVKDGRKETEEDENDDGVEDRRGLKRRRLLFAYFPEPTRRGPILLELSRPCIFNPYRSGHQEHHRGDGSYLQFFEKSRKNRGGERSVESLLQNSAATSMSEQKETKEPVYKIVLPDVYAVSKDLREVGTGAFRVFWSLSRAFSLPFVWPCSILFLLFLSHR